MVYSPLTTLVSKEWCSFGECGRLGWTVALLRWGREGDLEEGGRSREGVRVLEKSLKRLKEGWTPSRGTGRFEEVSKAWKKYRKLGGEMGRLEEG